MALMIIHIIIVMNLVEWSTWQIEGGDGWGDLQVSFIPGPHLQYNSRFTTGTDMIEN